MQKKLPMVSICVVTYNQKSYIRDCLDSLVNQEVDFKYEIIVGDDASSDGTTQIVIEYGERYPDLVFPILHKENIGAVRNMVHAYKRASGKYIAHMDGDDLALPGKIQLQANALEKNPGTVMCTHDVMVIDATSKKVNSSFRHHNEGVFTLENLYATLPFFAHSSKMFLNDVSSPFYDNLPLTTIDIEIHVAQAKKGDIYHIAQCLGAYRSMVGITSKFSGVNSIIPAATRRIFDEALKFDNKKISLDDLKRNYARSILNYAYQSALAGREHDCKAYALESINIKLYSVIQIAILMSCLIPRLQEYFSNFRRIRKEIND